MKQRVNAGTDVAMIGAWDASRNDGALSGVWGKSLEKTLEADAAAGHLFLIHMGGDGGGPIDVYVDEEVPAEEQKQARRIGGEFLISVPTGRLVVGGVEDYRSRKPKITGEQSVVSIPSGDYLLRCHVGKDEGGIQPPSPSELEEAVGMEEYRYYRKVTRWSYLGFLAILLFPVLTFLHGWKSALAITAVTVVAYFYVQDRFVLKRNAKYQRIAQRVDEVWKRAYQAQPPAFLFELHRVEGRKELKGGSIRLV